MFPQVWSDLNNLEPHDVDFLAHMQQLVKANESIFLQERRTIGDAWKDEVYGYSYFEKDHGFIFLNNMSFESRTAHLSFDKQIGFSSSAGASLGLQLHHPERATLAVQGNPGFASGQDIGIQLRPFEVALIEVTPGGTKASTPVRECVTSSSWHSKQLMSQSISFPAELKIPFADARSLEDQGFHAGSSAMSCELPEISDQRQYLALVCRFTKDGKPWRRSQMSEVAQATADMEGRTIEFTRTPPISARPATISGTRGWSLAPLCRAPFPENKSGLD